jgi:hypothetical protein
MICPMAEVGERLGVPRLGAVLPAQPVTAPLRRVVPLCGLPVVAAVLVLLVVALVGNWLWALDFAHVTAGALWTSIDLFVGLIIGPILGRLSVPARMEFSKRFMPAMLLIMPTLVTVTLAAGFQLARHLGDFTDPVTHPWIIAALVVVAAMSVIALAILEPANLAVLFELRKPRPDGRLIARLMRRFISTAGIIGLMQVATLIIMTRLATL